MVGSTPSLFWLVIQYNTPGEYDEEIWEVTQQVSQVKRRGGTMYWTKRKEVFISNQKQCTQSAETK